MDHLERMRGRGVLAILAMAMPLLAGRPAGAEITRFKDPCPGGNVIEYWRLTHDPAVRHHANYHNTNCWSPDGRYVCYAQYGRTDEVYLADLHTGNDLLLGPGDSPRWANRHNWCFYARRNREGGNPWEKGTEVLRYDCETGQTQLITWGMEFLGSADHADRYIYGNQRLRYLDGKQWHTGRAPIAPESPLEIIYQNKRAIRPLCNPRHDVISTRAKQKQAFETSRAWLDLDGANERIGVPMVQEGHMAWSGDGQYQLIGNDQAKGRLWNEPFPSDLHLLANCSFGDISPCGKSGRWICGDYGVADLRSGDGRGFPRPPSRLCFPTGTGDMSDAYDADPKGSPDGTKICFVSNYDFTVAPFTRLLQGVTKETRLAVVSTDGFPEAGDLEVNGEVVGYASKTPTSFEGLVRNKYGSGDNPGLRAGAFATLFDARRMTPEERKRAAEPPRWLLEALKKDREHPLLWQRQTDVYVSVVRLPDPPHLRLVGQAVELIPGENHWETFGYYLECDGVRVNEKPLRAGTRMTLAKAGAYQAVAVEWSGLEGKQSLPLVLKSPAALAVLAEKPADFSWTCRAWLAGGKEVGEAEARAAAEAVAETRHLHDGATRREHFRQGRLVAAEDLNADGKATRRVTYQADGKLATREYWTPADQRVSLETFGPDGFKREEIRWRYDRGKAEERDRWAYDRGWPVRHVIRGQETWEKQGNDWVKVK